MEVPIYEYRCERGHTFDVLQSMTDDPVGECSDCGAPVERVYHPVAIHFKGSGFYTTDYGRGKAADKKKVAEGSGNSKAGATDSSKEPSADSGTKTGGDESAKAAN